MSLDLNGVQNYTKKSFHSSPICLRSNTCNQQKSVFTYGTIQTFLEEPVWQNLITAHKSEENGIIFIIQFHTCNSIKTFVNLLNSCWIMHWHGGETYTYFLFSLKIWNILNVQVDNIINLIIHTEGISNLQVSWGWWSNLLRGNGTDWLEHSYAPT